MKKSIYILFMAAGIFSLFLFVFGILIYNGDFEWYFTSGKYFALGTLGAGIALILIGTILGRIKDSSFLSDGRKRCKTAFKSVLHSVLSRKVLISVPVLLVGAALSGVLFAVIREPSSGYTVVGYKTFMGLMPLIAAVIFLIWYWNKKK